MKPHAGSQAGVALRSRSQRAGPADRSELHRRAAGPRPPIFTPNEDLKLTYRPETFSFAAHVHFQPDFV